MLKGGHLSLLCASHLFQIHISVPGCRAQQRLLSVQTIFPSCLPIELSLTVTPGLAYIRAKSHCFYQTPAPLLQEQTSVSHPVHDGAIQIPAGLTGKTVPESLGVLERALLPHSLEPHMFSKHPPPKFPISMDEFPTSILGKSGARETHIPTTMIAPEPTCALKIGHRQRETGQLQAQTQVHKSHSKYKWKTTENWVLMRKMGKGQHEACGV